MKTAIPASALLTRRRLLAAGTCLGAAALAPLLPARADADPSPFDPTDRYVVRPVEGWNVLVHRDLLESRKPLGDGVLKLLAFQLFQITRVVPTAALEKLRQVRLWCEVKEGHHPCAAYHPDAGWLREHGMNPEKARCVELANAENFLSWTREQPWMVFHELAHSYHDQVLSFDNPEVRTAYEAAIQTKTYEKVQRISGGEERHYALTNPQEYFAELSESYFGTNDFYPFVRSELRVHDPAGFRMIEKAWGVRP